MASLLLALPIATALALLLNKPFRGRAIFRAILILPWIVSQLVSALLWRWLGDPIIGPVSYVAERLFGAGINIFGSPDSALAGLVIVGVWRTYPLAMILILAALQTVPEEVYEAARVDGAGAPAIFLRMTIPLIKSTVLVATILLSIHYVTMLEIPFVLTGGGPAGATELLGVKAYLTAFSRNDLGAGSAIAVLMFVMNVAFAIGYMRVLRRDET